MKQLSFFQQLARELLEIITYDLLDDRQFGILCLQDNKSLPPLTTCTSTDLSHHHKSMFKGTEIGLIEHSVGIQYTNNTDLIKIQSFTNHLGANKQIGTTCGEVCNQTFVGITGTSSVKVHTGHTRLREDVTNLILYLLRTITPSL